MQQNICIWKRKSKYETRYNKKFIWIIENIHFEYIYLLLGWLVMMFQLPRRQPYEFEYEFIMEVKELV